MQAIQFSQFGFKNLQLVELPQPIAGYQEVLVRVHAASLNYRDRVIIEGSYMPNLELPAIPLSDAAGEVVAVGAGVTRWKLGDRVTTHYSTTWLAGRVQPSYAMAKLGGPLPGVLQQYIAINQDAVVGTPDYLDDAQAATLPIAALTAWNAIEACDVKAGQTVLLQGTGGVSLFALQFAKQRGARVIITSSSDAKLARARTLGADDAINYCMTPNWAEVARGMTAGNGVDVVLDVGGHSTLGQSLTSICHGGSIAVIGFLGGAGDAPDLTRTLVTKRARLLGVNVGHRESFEEMIRAMTLTGIKPVIDRRYDIHEIAEAFALMGSKDNFGKVVMTF